MKELLDAFSGHTCQVFDFLVNYNFLSFSRATVFSIRRSLCQVLKITFKFGANNFDFVRVRLS